MSFAVEGAHRAAAPLIALREVDVRFGSAAALQGVDLAIAAGERVAFIGANGSGKSTLLRVLHGLLAPTAGRRELGLLPGGRVARQAMVFQRPFVLRMSVRANVMLGAWLGGAPRAGLRERADQALAVVGLAERARDPARALSVGQQQRLALARAWAVAPDLLLLDEPTASLDPYAKHEVERLVDDFAARGVTVLMSSHNLGQVKRCASRVVYLEGGRIRADAPVDAFFNGNAAPAAAAFLHGELPW